MHFLPQVGALMKRFDVDKSSELNFEEFYQLARFQLGFEKREWHRSIWFRVLNKWAFKGTADSPVTRVCVKHAVAHWLSTCNCH